MRKPCRLLTGHYAQLQAVDLCEDDAGDSSSPSSSSSSIHGRRGAAAQPALDAATSATMPLVQVGSQGGGGVEGTP
jgi:hypothetical protein